jgi:hypothetical protein
MGSRTFYGATGENGFKELDTMPPALFPTIPDSVIDWIDSRGGNHALLVISVDARLQPHVMMAARDEVLVVSPGRIRLAVASGSQTRRNLHERSSATIALYDEGLAVWIKAHATADAMPFQGEGFAIDLVVDEVKLDAPSPEEGGARLVSGLRFEGRKPRPDLREKLKAARFLNDAG